MDKSQEERGLAMSAVSDGKKDKFLKSTIPQIQGHVLS